MTNTDCILMNFDDRVRIVHDADNKPVEVKVGAVASCTLSEPIVEFIRNGMRHSDPLVLVDAVKEQPNEVIELMTLLGDLNSLHYDELLRRTHALVGAESFPNLRPSRAEIRYQLKEIAVRYAAGRADVFRKVVAEASEANKTRQSPPMRDDRDPDELDAAIREQREKYRREREEKVPQQALPPHELTEREKTDLALGIVGADPAGLAEALTRAPDPAESEEFDPSRGRPDPGPRKPRSKKPAGKKSSPTGRSAKAGSKAKKPAGRVRA